MGKWRQKNVVLIGMDDLKVKLATIQEKVGFEAAHTAMFEAAKVIEAEWKARIRSQPWKESEGNFEMSIEARYIKSRRKNAAEATVARRWIAVPKNEQPLWYGNKLEFGTSTQPAHPTGRPAFDASKDAAVGKANGILLREVLKLVAKEGG
jgi:HK97 gp10 family phage protein